MKLRLIFLFWITAFSTLSSQEHSPAPLHEFRGVWIASVANIDWPSRPGLSTEDQKRELLWLLDQHQRMGLNAVVFQIRPTADAFFSDGKEPWSYYLTGKQGQAPEPFYDPLEFAIEAAHDRNMELHAWFNPYRASQDSDAGKRSRDHISHTRPEWFYTYNNKTYFNPGIPEVREYIVEVILDVVMRYDVDGIHFDDYFYPYPGKDPLPDSMTYEKYGTADFNTIEDWRRNNVDLLVKELNESIHQAKPWVKFGISPFAIWRNKKEDPRGSETNGFTNYDGLFADVYKWLEEGWMDYVNPQIYFPFHYPPAAFEKLLDWWSKNSFGKQVYVGQAPYRSLEGKNGWEDWSQLPRQVRALRQKDNIHGSVYFSSRSLMNNMAGFADSLRLDLYQHPALIPPMKWLDSIPPAPPANVRATVIDRFVRLRWDSPAVAHDAQKPYGYVVYRFEENGPIDLESGAHIVGISFKPQPFFFDAKSEPGKKYRYVIRAMDRIKNLSTPAPVVEVVIPD
ncbi:family 10 glycosylhydrolase [Membranicola marinus]|uniref:Family 10 glycosylhydrolase n=1 Tax=Membranihabitans marinus TaxID=1227546 RepID=A0A953LBK9_9BACT|nr:family 10 glycosylhydrolase [Membranihabitans marinus]MBY5956744.1 family 10 glycosylhydrolase [Membranihabitans marinus]